MLKVAAEVGGAVEVAVRLMSSYDVVVDAVEQRARNFAHVVGALVLVADAFLLGVAVVPARARIHRSHQHE